MSEKKYDREKGEKTFLQASQTFRDFAAFTRAVHGLFAAIVLGGFVFSQSHQALKIHIVVTVISGFVLGAVEWLRKPEPYREVYGWATIIKVIALGFVPFYPKYALIIVFFVFFSAAWLSHASRRWRHKRLF